MTILSTISSDHEKSDSGPTRTVARPIANLGNTCYMNAVLQALSHAPELCLAMDCESHSSSCPIAATNILKKRKSPTTLPDGGTSSKETTPVRRVGLRKSRRALGRKSPTSDDGRRPAGREETEYCALCELESHFKQVHSENIDKKNKPVAPFAFVNGFINHIAPWFRLGLQEDSHEFLRLLIDAMQKSCEKSRLPTNPPDDSALSTVSHSDPLPDGTSAFASADGKKEYPFYLFRGKIESNVICDSCAAVSATFDPIEDIGLEVTADPSALHTTASPVANTTTPTTNTVSTAARSSLRNSPFNALALADVQSAFQRFARAESLEGYKCEKCGKLGKATKQSRLSSIPPILTLHLKRFRYGGASAVKAAAMATRAATSAWPGSSSTAANANGGDATKSTIATPPLPSARTTRSGRSEVNQLLGHTRADYLLGGVGKSGSAKIEGHIRFSECFDLKPYLTDELQKQHNNMYCRLFAVVVHAGKDSHAGHYYSFVRSLGKNEWWKMDDSRVTPVPISDVLQAEAYMLFYRVLHHPIALDLETRKDTNATLEQAETILLPINEGLEVEDDSSLQMRQQEQANSNKENFAPGLKRKRVENFDDWNRARSAMPPHLLNLMQKAEEMVADRIVLKPDSLKRFSRESATESSLHAAREDAVEENDAALSTTVVKNTLTEKLVVEDDVVGGTDFLRHNLRNFFYMLGKHFDAEGGTGTSWLTNLEKTSDNFQKNDINSSNNIFSDTLPSIDGGNSLSFKIKALAEVNLDDHDNPNVL